VHTRVPNSGPNYNTLFGVAASGGQAWAVGVTNNASYQAHSLIEARNGKAWHIAATPRLGSARDVLFSAAVVSPSDVWTVGAQLNKAGRFTTLVEHWDSTHWSVVRSANPGSSGKCLRRGRRPAR
jgi:hypothetical protein